MLSKKLFEKIKKDLESLSNYNVVLYGSILSPYFSNSSDIDVCVITMNKNASYNKNLWFSLFSKVEEKYDLRVFELMPLFLKIEIIENHKILFGDKLEISEYFYFYRKIWRDMERRIKENKFRNLKEIIEGKKRLAYLTKDIRCT